MTAFPMASSLRSPTSGIQLLCFQQLRCHVWLLPCSPTHCCFSRVLFSSCLACSDRFGVFGLLAAQNCKRPVVSWRCRRGLAVFGLAPHSCARLLVCRWRASGVPSRALDRLPPANTSSQSISPTNSPLTYSL